MLPKIIGNQNLTQFDALIIGSGAGGAAAAAVLTANSKKVLVLEAGPNYFYGLDDPNPLALKTVFSNDELKMIQRGMIMPSPIVEPRTFRARQEDGVRRFIGDVNHLPQTVGGGSIHADLKTPRFLPNDFHLGSLLKNRTDANFADWPVDYDMLEKFYCFAEKTMGVQGVEGSNPFEGYRSEPFPLPPGVPMALGLMISEAARRLGYHPFAYPTAINSRPYDGRPACSDCGFCGEYGCPTSAKGSPAVTFLRKALLTGNCLLLSETRAVKFFTNSAKNKVTHLEAIGPKGEKEVFTADRFILAASPIEDVRLLLFSDLNGVGLGNSSGLVGKNLMFHFQTHAVGIFEERLHPGRGRVVTHGMVDFRGDPTKPGSPLGGILEFGAGPDPIHEATTYALDIGLRGKLLKNFLKESPLRDHMAVLTMQAEDAPQLSNQIDLDPEVCDLDKRPVPRITYKNHKFEKSARKYYIPKLFDLLKEAGAQYAFISPRAEIPSSRHILGTLRFGKDPKTSVCRPDGRMHDIGNLYVADGALFPTSSGINPTLTISTLASYVAANMVNH